MKRILLLLAIAGIVTVAKWDDVSHRGPHPGGHHAHAFVPPATPIPPMPPLPPVPPIPASSSHHEVQVVWTGHQEVEGLGRELSRLDKSDEGEECEDEDDEDDEDGGKASEEHSKAAATLHKLAQIFGKQAEAARERAHETKWADLNQKLADQLQEKADELEAKAAELEEEAAEHAEEEAAEREAHKVTRTKRVKVVRGPEAPVNVMEPAAGPVAAWFGEVREGRVQPLDHGAVWLVKGRRSLRVDSAAADAHALLMREAKTWLLPEVPTSWTDGQAGLINNMIVEVSRDTELYDPEKGLVGLTQPSKTQLYEKGLIGLDEVHKEAEKPRSLTGTITDVPLAEIDSIVPMYVVGYKVDASPERRAEIVEAYRRQVGMQRLAAFGGGLGFVVFCLAVLLGYIRADEVTKGFYTRKLRFAAGTVVAAGAGALLYRWMA